MIFRFFQIIASILFLISCNTSNLIDNKFTCAQKLSDKELNNLKSNNFKDYSDSDLELLADITTLIIKSNGDTSEFEVFYNRKTDTSLTIDIYGLEIVKQIDKTVCDLKNTNEIDLPNHMNLLFHRYVNGYDDGGIIVGLSIKKSTMKNNLKIEFKNPQEIRMGSPYMIAELVIHGLNIDLPKNDWQNKYSISSSNKWLALVQFDLTDNEPGFIFYIVDLENEIVTMSKRIEGLLNDLKIDDDKISFNRFVYDKSKSKADGFCCNIDDEILISTTANNVYTK